MPKQEFLFDVKLFASIRVAATSEKHARQMIADCLEACDANFGAWADGSPILGEASIDGPADLIEIDGEAV